MADISREEAIEILKGAIKKPNTKDGYLGQALTMGIEALENQKSVIEELEEIKDKIMWEANGQFCARIVSGRVIDILDERIKELNIEKEKGKCSMCDKEAIAYLIYAKKFVCVDCIDKLLHYCCVGENKQ